MKTQRMTILAVASALLLVLALFASFVIEPMLQGDTKPIELPPETSQLPPPGGSDFTSPQPATTGQELTHLSVTLDNVQALVATLEKAESYSLNYTERRYFTGGQREWSHEKYVLDGFVKLVQLDSAGKPETIRITGNGRAYIWPEGGAAGYEGAQGQFETDVLYLEELIEAPRESLTSVEVNPEQNHLFVSLLSGDKERGYLIDITTGLLLEYTQFVDGQPVYTYLVTNLTAKAPAKDEFLKPNGHSVFGE